MMKFRMEETETESGGVDPGDVEDRYEVDQGDMW